MEIRIYEKTTNVGNQGSPTTPPFTWVLEESKYFFLHVYPKNIPRINHISFLALSPEKNKEPLERRGRRGTLVPC